MEEQTCTNTASAFTAVRPARPFLPLLLALFLAAQAGCGLTADQKAAIADFSTATKNLADVGSEEFARSRRDVIAMNKMRMRLGKDVGSLDGPLDAEDVAARTEALAALRAYGTLLNKLATSNRTAEIKKASNNFASKIGAVEGVDLSDEEAGAISSAVQAVGGLLIEHMRKKAAVRVVDSTNDTVKGLADNVKRSFAPDGEHWSLGYDLTVEGLAKAIDDYEDADNRSEGQEASSSEDNQGQAAKEEGKTEGENGGEQTDNDGGDGNEGKADKGQSDQGKGDGSRGAAKAEADQSVLGEAKALLREKKKHKEIIRPKIRKAAEQLRAAQEDLKVVVHTDGLTPSSIEAFIEQIDKLATLYNVLRED